MDANSNGVNSLAVLVIIFADVAEVCSKSFHSKRTRDFSTLPLNDHTYTREHKCQGDLDTSAVSEKTHPVYAACENMTVGNNSDTRSYNK